MSRRPESGDFYERWLSERRDELAAMLDRVRDFYMDHGKDPSLLRIIREIEDKHRAAEQAYADF